MYAIVTYNIKNALYLFICAAMTDFFDGFFARIYNQVTLLGTIMDPLADKVLTIGVLLSCWHVGYIPTVAIAIMIFKESILIAFSALFVCARLPSVIMPAYIGKIAMAGYIMYILMLLLHELSYICVSALLANAVLIGVLFLHLMALMYYIIYGFIKIQIMVGVPNK